MKQITMLSLIVALLFTQRLPLRGAEQPNAPAVSVVDIIGLSRISHDEHNVVSPSREWVAAVIYRGNVAHNAMEYTLLVFRMAELRSGQARPQALAQFSAVSNNPVISQLQWLNDDTLVFCAEKTGQPSQAYSVNVRTHQVKQLTHSRQKVLVFRAWENGDVVYIPQEDDPSPSSRDLELHARGFSVDPESWFDTYSPNLWWRAEAVTTPRPRYARATVHWVRGGKESVTLLPERAMMEGETDITYAALEVSIAPTRDSVMALQTVNEDPAWNTYRDGVLKQQFDSQGGRLPSASTWSVIDLHSGTNHLLTGMPVMHMSWVPLWLDNGKSVIIPGAILPVEGADDRQREIWTKYYMVAEFDVATGKVLHVFGRRDELGDPVSWEPRTATLTFNKRVGGNGPSTPVGYHKTASGWISFAPNKLPSAESVPRLKVSYGPNQPWTLVAVDPQSNKERQVYDPNPGLLQSRRFANKTVAEWQTKAGHHWKGSLYWPLDYVKGHRYPLFIQTYRAAITGFDPEGAFSTGFAAQALAVQGIMVLQIGLYAEDAPAADKEPQRQFIAQQEGVEAAIDYLDGEGLIDRAKVGINGFSQTCGGTLFFLTHSEYPMAVAAIADGVDWSYLQYLAAPKNYRYAEARNGGKPFVGQGLDEWMKRSPSFNLHRVKAPLLLTAIEDRVVYELEPLSALRAQGKPAELLWIPEGIHELVKPWTRVTSQQGTVDWVRFWLQGYERKEPILDVHETAEELADRYARWRKLREMQEANGKPN